MGGCNPSPPVATPLAPSTNYYFELVSFLHCNYLLLAVSTYLKTCDSGKNNKNLGSMMSVIEWMSVIQAPLSRGVEVAKYNKKLGEKR